jgi:hypothetical protein
MTLELSQSQRAEAVETVEKFLSEISTQERELYSHQEVENMLLDIYILLKK